MNLNNSMREKITANILFDCFEKREEKLRKEWLKFARGVHKGIMGDYLRKIKNLPKGLINYNSYYYAKFGGEGVSIYLIAKVPVKNSHGYYDCGNLNGSYERFPWDKGMGKIEFSAKSPETEAFRRITGNYQSLLDEKEALEAKVKGSLGGARTVKKLLAQWPDVKKHLPADLETMTAQLPMIPAEDLNTMIKKAKTAA